MEPEYTRALRLAASATGQNETGLAAHLQSQHVEVSIAAQRPADIAAAELFLANLARLPITLTVGAVSGADAQEHRRLVAASRRPSPNAPGSADTRGSAILRVHVGNGGSADLHGSPERHGAHVSRSPLSVAGPANGLGAVTCASMLSGEVFKAIAPVLASRRRDLDDAVSWCPVSLEAEPGATAELTRGLDLDVAIIGVGAVGTAVARILGLLDARGYASLVDPERFAPENLGTYSLGDYADASGRLWKTAIAARALPNVQTTRFDMPVNEFINLIDAGSARWPSIALTGLDSVDARRDAQLLWPDRLLDGATGDTMCGLHDVGTTSGACLRCLFPVPTGGPSAVERLANATGLDPELLRHGDQQLRESDLAMLTAPQRARLADHVGKPICGLADAVGLTGLPSEDYRPSVPFVSQQAACLVVGRLIADDLGLSDRATFVQYDTLIGPAHGTFEKRAALPTCFCQTRALVVERVRAARQASVPQPSGR